MKQKKSLVMFGIGILILSLLAVPRAMVWAQKAQEKPIRLGVLVDFTGPMAFSSQPVLDGVKMRLEEANYKVAGRTIELVVEDAATDASIALEKANKMVERNNVSIIIRPMISGMRMAVIPYLAKQKVLL